MEAPCSGHNTLSNTHPTLDLGVHIITQKVAARAQGGIPVDIFPINTALLVQQDVPMQVRLVQRVEVRLLHDFQIHHPFHGFRNAEYLSVLLQLSSLLILLPVLETRFQWMSVAQLARQGYSATVLLAKSVWQGLDGLGCEPLICGDLRFEIGWWHNVHS